MDRKEFLSALGMGTMAAVCAYCLDGCKQPDNPVSAPTNVDFTLDPANPAYVYNGGVIVARTVAGICVAVSQACTHQGTTVVCDASGNQFYCPSHGSTFATTGAVTRGPAGSPLVAYKTTLTGNSHRVSS